MSKGSNARPQKIAPYVKFRKEWEESFERIFGGKSEPASPRPRDDRPGRHLDDLDIDSEILELELDQPRHRLERFLRVALSLHRRVIE